MDLKEIIAVSGLPGLYKVVNNRQDGLLIKPLSGEGQSKFVSQRKHQFTPLETISIYTDVDSVELKIIFRTMKGNAETTPVVSPSASANDLKAYLETTLPNYDKDRVYVSDIKKLIKWYNALDEQGLITMEDEVEEKEESAEE